MSDRPVSTDALATLGTIIGPNEKRDAIHLAVMPVIAGMDLSVGDDIGIVDGVATNRAPNKIGIVDPFLKAAVNKGEGFWLVIYPRVITSLRHVWSHPAVPDEVGNVSIKREAAIAWLTNYADGMGTSYEDLLNALEHEGTFDGQPDYYNHDPQDCKPYYEIATGKPWPCGVTNYFSCAC